MNFNWIFKLFTKLKWHKYNYKHSILSPTWMQGSSCNITTITPECTIIGSGDGGFKFKLFTAERLPLWLPFADWKSFIYIQNCTKNITESTCGSPETCRDKDGDRIESILIETFGLSNKSKAKSYNNRYTMVAYIRFGGTSVSTLELNVKKKLNQ